MSKRRSASLFNPSNLSSDLLKQAQQNAFRAGLKQGISAMQEHWLFCVFYYQWY